MDLNASKVEAPKVEAPKVEAPKVEAPKVEAPKVEAPKVEAPKVEAPKVEAPKVEAPSVDDAVATAGEVTTQATDAVAAEAEAATEAAGGALAELEVKAIVMRDNVGSAISNMENEVEAAATSASDSVPMDAFSEFLTKVKNLFESCMKMTEACMNKGGSKAEEVEEAMESTTAAATDEAEVAFDKAAKTNPYAQDPADK